MKKRKRKTRFTDKAFIASLWGVRGLWDFILAIICCFIFLRVYGIPGFALRPIVQCLNDKGVPVDVKSVKLTFGGWKASQVKLFSLFPDDTEPVLFADEVFFDVGRAGELDHGFSIHVVTDRVKITPSIEWGVLLSEES